MRWNSDRADEAAVKSGRVCAIRNAEEIRTAEATLAMVGISTFQPNSLDGVDAV
jgi:hypothetical protein